MISPPASAAHKSSVDNIVVASESTSTQSVANSFWNPKRSTLGIVWDLVSILNSKASILFCMDIFFSTIEACNLASESLTTYRIQSWMCFSSVVIWVSNFWILSKSNVEIPGIFEAQGVLQLGADIEGLAVLVGSIVRAWMFPSSGYSYAGILHIGGILNWIPHLGDARLVSLWIKQTSTVLVTSII